MRTTESKWAGVTALIAAVLLAALYRRGEAELVVHAAAVLSGPLEEIRTQWDARSRIRLNVTYDGSGAILGRLRAGVPGDVFLAAEESYMTAAINDHLVIEGKTIATMTPVLAVMESNPRRIEGIADLVRSDVRVSLADPDTAAIGLVAGRRLVAAGLWPMFQEHLRRGMVAYQGTVTKSASDVAIGAADVSVVWLPTAHAANLEVIAVSDWADEPEKVRGGVLRRSRETKLADAFLQFLIADPGVRAVFVRRRFGS